jgi:hypothetical protein
MLEDAARPECGSASLSCHTPAIELEKTGHILHGIKMPETTLARKLGLAPHLSLLRNKAARLGVEDPEDWIALAVQRGCHHYTNHRRAKPIPTEAFSNEELSALLLSGANFYRPFLIRVAAQLLSDPAIGAKELVRLCQMENALSALAWIAQAGGNTEPGNTFWTELRTEIRKQSRRELVLPTSVFPHPSRFRVETGFQRFSKNKTIQKQWLRPIQKSFSEGSTTT